MATFEAPKWFNYEFYMGAKLAQVVKADPEGNWTMPKLVAEFAKADFVGEEGAYNHFVAFGASEDVAPNAIFNANEYYAAKAAQFYGVEPKAVTDLQIATVKALIEKAGYNAWTHYDAFGSDEGVNPSNAFDADAYMAAKAAAMGGDWTKEKIAEAFKANGFTALEHFMLFGGKGEGEISAEQVKAGFPVSDENKVPTDVTGKTFTLTTGLDTVSGTAGDDTIMAPVIDGTKFTLTAGDTIDGGAGNDTLNVYGGSFNGVTMKNVEIVNHQADASINVSAFADVKEVWQNAAATTNTVTAQLTTKIGFGGTSTGVQNVAFTKADGAADTATVALNGVSMTSVTVTGGIEAQTLELAGKNVTAFSNTNMTSLTITGEGSLAGNAKGDVAAAITAGTNTLKSVDASAAKGDLNINLTGAAVNTGFTYSGSAGNDRVVLGRALVATDKIDLGEGTTDTLSVTSADVTAKAAYDLINGVKGLDVIELGGTTALSVGYAVDASKLNVNTFKLTADATGAIATSSVVAQAGAAFTGLASDGSDTIVLAANLTGGAGTTTTNMNGAAALSLALATADGKADAATINVAAATTLTGGVKGGTGAGGVGIDAHVFETLNITADGNLTVTAGGTTPAATVTDTLVATGATLNISGKGNVDLGTVANATGVADATNHLTINAADLAGSLTVVTGAGNDTITAGKGGSTITAGKGADTITLGAGVDTLNYAAGDSGVAGTNTITGIDVVKGFTAGAGGDKLDFTGSATFTALNATQLADVAKAANILAAANAADTAAGTTATWTAFAYEGKTYALYADATSGFDAANDVIIELNGVNVADLNAANFA